MHRFAAAKGGLLFNAIGLFFIGFWNYYAANCLLRCLPYLPSSYNNDKLILRSSFLSMSNCSMTDLGQKLHPSEYGALESPDLNSGNGGGISIRNAKEQFTSPPPPEGTTTFGAVAWYASGPQGKTHAWNTSVFNVQ